MRRLVWRRRRDRRLATSLEGGDDSLAVADVDIPPYLNFA